jgi:hypothetical protein
MMMIEGRRFLELAVHVKLASEATIAAARQLVSLRPRHAIGDEATAWARVIDQLIAMNLEIGSMERILRRAARRRAEPNGGRRKPRSIAV